MILSLLVAPIRAALDISDTAVSLLIGLAFALFYTLLGLPIAWIADRWNRRNLIVVGVALWSAMTARCGFAGSSAALFAARDRKSGVSGQSVSVRVQLGGGSIFKKKKKQ